LNKPSKILKSKTEIKITRAWGDGKTSLGILTVVGSSHRPLFTIERFPIPPGVYTCKPFSGPKFKGVYEICDVPGRTAILFHQGNAPKDSEGCVLVGLTASWVEGQPFIGASRLAFDCLKDIVKDSEFSVTILDGTIGIETQGRDS
jgi:hypothetical protein